MSLYECLEEYKKITLELIGKINNDEDIEDSVEKRAEVIKKIGDVNFSNEEFKEKIEYFNILDLDNKLQTLIKEEKTKTKNKIDILRKTRIAKKKYSRAGDNQILFSAKS